MTGKLLLSAREIADALGVHKRAVQLRADRGSWAHVIEAHTNGRPIKLYDVTRLPAEVREELARHQLTTQPENQAVEVRSEKLPEVSAPAPAVAAADWQRRAADARAALLAEVDRLAEVHGSDRAIRALVSAAADGSLSEQLARFVPLANARSAEGGGRTLSERTVKRWRAARAREGWTGLLPLAPAARPEPAWGSALLSIYRRPTNPPLTEALIELARRLPAGVEPPTYAQARHYLDKLPPQVREAGRRGPNALLGLRGHKIRSSEGLMPMDVITADGHAFKSAVAHPQHGRPFRPEVVAVLDVATRMVVGWSVGLAEGMLVVRDAYLHAFTRFGRAGVAYTDNGPGFAGRQVGGDEIGMLARCGVMHETSTPGRPQSRGKIERLMATLWGPAERALPTYQGALMDPEALKRVSKRIERDVRSTGGSRVLLSWAEFLDLLRDRVDAYNNSPHRALRRVRDDETGRTRYQTPAEAMAQARADGWEPDVLPQALLDDIDRIYEVRTCQRGWVTLPWGKYYDDQLVPYTDQRVRVGYSIHDASRVWVRDASGRAICIAERDANVVPEVSADALEHIARQRHRRRLKTAERRIEEIDAEFAGQVVEHQLPATPDIPRITSIRVAPTQKPTEAPAPALSAAAAEWQRSAQVVEIRPGAAAPAAATEAEVRYARAREIERRVDAGESITESESSWLAKYRTRPEYRVRRELEEQRAAILAR
ncbi:MAG TPA: hypothetical protein DCK97_00210 [Tistrella mobilis]|uniref:Transposase n=1 Tax=Tistrella mobilis TaxID=171437 RepID=A0A3B9IDJ3_9PROT|nr:hypothetical protein [Tistrella mobilis]